MNKKKLFMIMFIVVSISFIFTGSVAYYNVTVNGNINVTTGNAVFNITGFTNESTKEIILKEGALAPGDFGSFNLHLDASGSNVDMYVTLSIDKGTLPTNLKFYTTSDYKSELHKCYEFMDASNQSKDITIYWYWDPFISDEEDNKFINSNNLTATVNVSAVQISEYAMMKNGYKEDSDGNNISTEFWNDTYSSYIRTIKFGNDLSNLPSSCTGDSDLCWDVSYDSTQENKVYAYLLDAGLDSGGNDLYNLYIVSEVPIFAPSSCESMFFRFTELTSIDFNNNFNTSNVIDMSCMFWNCRALVDLDLSSFNTSNVTDMGSMFYYCSSLTNLDFSSFNTSNVTDMNSMFEYCLSLISLDLSSFNTSNVTDMADMFYECSSLTSLDINNFNTSNVTDIGDMFLKCSSLTSLDVRNFNTSNVTYMSRVFYKCSSLTSLDLSSFNTSKVTDMREMFESCSSLASLDLSGFNTVNVTDMQYMFGYCSSLTSLNLSGFNTSNVKYITGMFRDCSSLTATINIMGAGVTSYSYMFSGAATNAGAQITVNYIVDASTKVDRMIATKSINSNVVKGSQI